MIVCDHCGKSLKDDMSIDIRDVSITVTTKAPTVVTASVKHFYCGDVCIICQSKIEAMLRELAKKIDPK